MIVLVKLHQQSARSKVLAPMSLEPSSWPKAPLGSGYGQKVRLSTSACTTAGVIALDALRRHACDAAQGYWVCRPAPGADVTRFLAGGTASRDGSRGGHLL
jgi:hypothetical protein